jgi:hypothetical protein
MAECVEETKQEKICNSTCHLAYRGDIWRTRWIWAVSCKPLPICPHGKKAFNLVHDYKVVFPALFSILQVNKFMPYIMKNMVIIISLGSSDEKGLHQ